MANGTIDPNAAIPRDTSLPPLTPDEIAASLGAIPRAIRPGLVALTSLPPPPPPIAAITPRAPIGIASGPVTLASPSPAAIPDIPPVIPQLPETQGERIGSIIRAGTGTLPESSLGNRLAPGESIPEHEMVPAYQAAQPGLTEHQAGQLAYQELRPQLTAPAGSADWYQQRIQQIEFDKAHPWGAPISSHPGTMGRIGHIAAEIGNIAGDVLAPGRMAAIPGTQMHQALQERALVEEANKQQQFQLQQKEIQAELAKMQMAARGTPEWTDQGLVMVGPKGEATPVLMNGKPLSKEAADKYQLVQSDEGQYYAADLAAVARGESGAITPLTTADGQPLVGAQKGAKAPIGEDLAQQYTSQVENAFRANPRLKGIDPSPYRVLPTDTDAQARQKISDANALISQQTGQQRIVIQTAQQATSRSDRSYQFTDRAIQRLRQPVDSTAGRLANLDATLAQANPQSDALIAPELLSIMAGGQGSGLRMNEAEISRIVGGRSVWQNLQASAQRWSTNPDAARSITPAQDRQIRALVGAVRAKINAKLQVFQQAEDRLDQTDDPAEHRRILGDAQARLEKIDTGGAGPGGETRFMVTDPRGTPHYFKSQQDADAFKKAARIQ